MSSAIVQDGRPAADCPPGPVRVTKSLLGYGVIAGPFYVAASLAEALTRAGFSLARDDSSLLADGALGWIHMLVLVLTGVMTGAAAAGVVRQLRAEQRNTASGWFLGVYAAGLAGAGLFAADAADGFPPGTPPGATLNPSWHGMLHIAFGGAGFSRPDHRLPRAGLAVPRTTSARLGRLLTCHRRGVLRGLRPDRGRRRRQQCRSPGLHRRRHPRLGMARAAQRASVPPRIVRASLTG